MQKVECVIEALLAHVGENFGPGWKENSHESVDVLLAQLDARVGQVEL
jgi:hypothetical protein